jgi:ABC-type transport system involved in multi-copper enzyme maturation permease subunit
MTVLPLFGRELRARARNRATYWVRFAAALVGAIVCLPELLSGDFRTTAGSSGKFIFNGIVVIGFLLASFGSLLTADVLSRERREGTLGLLLLTRVRRLDILLGKLGAAGLTSTCALAALLPLMMIPVLAGGVTGGEAFRKGLALLNSLFLALAAGLWASAGSRDQSRAIGRTVRMMIALVILPVVVEGLFQVVFESIRPAHNPILGSIFTLLAASDSNYKSSPGTYWISFFLVHIAAWALLVTAGRFLRDATQSDEEIIPDRFKGDEYYESLKRKWRPAWTGQQQQPIEYLTQRQRRIKGTIWAAALIGLLLQFGVLGVMPFGVLSIMRWLPINMISGALLAWAMSRFTIESRRSGALELLMTTPVGARTIVASQWNGLKRLLRWPLLIMLFPYLLQILMVGWGASPIWPADRMIRQWTFIFFGLTNTFFGVAALCWTGLWFGFRARSQVGAIVWTVGIAKGVPFFIYLISQGLFIAGIIPTGISMPYDVRWYIPQILTLLYYIRLMVWVRVKFLSELPGSDPLRFTLLRLVEVPPAKVSFQTVRD